MYTSLGCFVYGLALLETDTSHRYSWYRQLNLNDKSPLLISSLNAAFMVGQAFSFIVTPLLVKMYGYRKVWIIMAY
jgi:hypothetical protein